MGDNLFDLESDEYGYVLLRYRFVDIVDGAVDAIEVQSNIEVESAVLLAESFLEEYGD